MVRTLESRVKVVGPALGVGAVLAWVFALKVPDYALEVWASVLAGPFAGLWATATWGTADALGWAAVCLLAVAAHPIRRGWLTGAVSVAAVGLWVLLGLMLTFDGV